MTLASTRTVWILRHGEAATFAPTDASRPLTPHGCKQARHSAGLLLAEPLQLILVSPYLRAQQTAQRVHEVLGSTIEMRTVPWLTPDSDPDTVLAELDNVGADNLLLVSHQPLVSSLIGLLERGDRASPYPMGTASLAQLEGVAPLAGLMTLRSLRHAPR